MRPEYLFSKIEFLYIATKFNDEARAKLVLRWAELENAQMVYLPEDKKINEVDCLSYEGWLIKNVIHL